MFPCEQPCFRYLFFTLSDEHPFLFSSLPSVPKDCRTWERVAKAVVPFAATTAAQPPAAPACPRRGAGHSHRLCFPWGQQASLHTAASLEVFLKFQAGSEALQLKYPGVVATAHFVIWRKPPFFHPSQASRLRPPGVVGLCGSSHLGLS